jgi:hypothetical protein
MILQFQSLAFIWKETGPAEAGAGLLRFIFIQLTVCGRSEVAKDQRPLVVIKFEF